MKRPTEIKSLVVTGVYAALIALGVLIRIPMPTNFVHVANGLVLLGVLLLGFKRGAVAGAIGLFVFDLYAGYLSSNLWIQLETIVVVGIVYSLWHNVFQEKATWPHLITVGIVGGAAKIGMKVVVELLKASLVGLSSGAAWATVVQKLPASISTAIVTAVLVALLYFPMRKIVDRIGLNR